MLRLSTGAHNNNCSHIALTKQCLPGLLITSLLWTPFFMNVFSETDLGTVRTYLSPDKYKKPSLKLAGWFKNSTKTEIAAVQ